MTLLYACDFSSLANASLSASGLHVIDGMNWYAKGSLTAGGVNTYTRDLVNGSGLSLRTLGTALTPIGSSASLTYPHWFFPLSQLTYTSTIPLLIRARFRYVGGLSKAWVGLVDSTNDSANLTAGARAADHLVCPTPSAGTSATIGIKNGVNEATCNARTGAIANTSCVVGILHKFLGTFEIKGSETAAGAFPTGFTMLVATPGADECFDPGARANAGIFFGMDSAGGSAHGVYLEHLRIDMIDGYVAPPVVNPAPVITLVSPAPGTQISRITPFVVDITDTAAFGYLVMVQMESGQVHEVAHDGTVFSSLYSAGSTVDAVSGGYRVTLRRQGGWVSAPTFTVRAYDGNIV